MLNSRARMLRHIARGIGWVFVRILTRTTITGREHLHASKPIIYTANHASTFDALLAILLIPPDTTLVGPGDFKLLWPGDWIVQNADVILTKRGSVDRDGLKRMVTALKSGGRLSLFPEGGTWEKPLDEVKSGVTYLSQVTGAQIVPIGLGGTYQVWRRIFRLQFPRITIQIGAPLPPVQISPDRKRRQEELQAAAVDLMYTIYDLLPPDTQARYDVLASQEFSGRLQFHPDTIPVPNVTFDALAELVTKPNLFSPLHRNARLPIQPLVRHGRYVSAQEMKTAVDALYAAFMAGNFANYLEYRLGDAKAGAIRTALTAISTALEADGARDVNVAFVATVTEREQKLS